MFVYVVVTVLFFSFLIDFLTWFCATICTRSQSGCTSSHAPPRWNINRCGHKNLYYASRHRLVVTQGEVEKVKEGYQTSSRTKKVCRPAGWHKEPTSSNGILALSSVAQLAFFRDHQSAIALFSSQMRTVTD